MTASVCEGAGIKVSLYKVRLGFVNLFHSHFPPPIISLAC